MEKFLWYNVQDYHGVLGAPAAATEESFMQRARELIRDIFRQTDLVLLALCCIATAFGILMIYSATRYMNTLRLVLVQTGGAVIGIILFFLLSLVDVNELMRKRGWLWLTLFGLGMILLLKSPFGEAGDTGNLAWLDFPFLPFMIQPSEIVKLTFTVVLAWQLVWLQENRTLRKVPDVLFLGAHLMMFFLLYYKISSDMGSDLVFVAIFICMCFVAGVSKGWFIGGGLTAALAFYILWEEDVIEDYMKNRFIVVFDHSFHPMEEGWQQTRSLLTLGGGKLTGMGLFKGIQTQSTDSSSLPNRHTDFIFSVIGEELGMLGCLAVLLLGGYDKHLDFHELFEALRGRVRALVLLGATRDQLLHTAADCGMLDLCHMADTFREAVDMARALAVPGDVVLLSPASASWGMFDNFEQRGRVFKEIVNGYAPRQ